ncbi:hypothetical protein [Mycolicibacterium sp. F2034L]|uniref:hypothetical protein n=1 Tax=Mycolicibacterium sp. F2034L TaxID=2926422 RepID=UPI001FF56A51|nr:hypothetical protein [Mycolicibacterium sp. F2034L]MCK0173500.1 hypothetical protein [Mycolicibacterium sp. F2034L]
MRFAITFVAALLAVLTIPATPAGATKPNAPDLQAYTSVPAEGFVVGREAYFQTPDGLLCAMLPDQGRAGCHGRLPGTASGANEIALAADVNARGLRSTVNPGFVKPLGGAAPVLREGQKLVFGDFECGVGPGPTTACTEGTPATQWLVVSPAGTGVGPPTEGLPDSFPDPNDFVVGDESYIVGMGPKNMFPVFTVDGGLTCSIVVFSGGEIGCDGPLPGVTGGENEVYAQLPGGAGIRRTDDPRFSTPAYPGPIRRLPVGHRVNGIGSTCMAIPSGVACYGTIGDTVQGFEVTPDGVSTFGG